MEASQPNTPRGVTAGIALELLGIAVTVLGVSMTSGPISGVTGVGIVPGSPTVAAIGVLVALVGFVMHIAGV